MINGPESYIYVVAPITSTVTAGALFFAGRYILQTSKVLSGIEERVKSNEQELEYIRERVNEMVQG